MRGGATLRAFVELARLSNAPTVITNVLVGCAIGAAGGILPWTTVAVMAAAILLLYVAGMALNDVIDVSVDRTERPERPLPSGRISVPAALFFALACLGGGLAISFFYGPAARIATGVLVIVIVLYDLLHKKSPATAVLMGACRGLVYVAAAAAVAWPVDWSVLGPLAIAITLYIIILTAVARKETAPRESSWPMIVLPLAALWPALIIHPQEPSWMTILAALVMIAWLVSSGWHLMRTPPCTAPAIHGFLAGICLVDAFYLTLLDQPLAALIAGGCFIITALGHRVIVGT